MDIIDNIRSAYENGDELTSEMIEELRLSFDIRDRLNNLFSLDVESSPKKMRDLLEKKGYTLDILKNLRFGLSSVAEGIDLKKINIFIASMENNIDEFYVSSAVYYNSMANANTDLNMMDKYKSCIDKLVSKGYSKENVIKAINDYSSTGQFDLGKSKGITIKLVKTTVKKDVNTAGVKDKQEADLHTTSVLSESDKDNSIHSTEQLSSTELDGLVKEFYKTNPELTPPAFESVLGVSDQGADSEDVNELVITDFGEGVSDDAGSKEDGEFIQPDNSLKNRFLGQGVDPFDPSYSAQKIGTQPSESDLFLGEPDEEIPNPFEVPQEGLLKRIVKKVKRPISKPDFTKLKKAMLNSLSRLMQKASNALQAKADLNNDISDELPPRIDFDDYFMPEGDEKRKGR